MTLKDSGPRWAKLSDEELLKVRICELDLSIEGSQVESYVKKLNAELESKGLK